MSGEAKKIEESLKPVVADPEAVHRQVIADLMKEKGEQWVKDHAQEIENGWLAAKALFGL